MTIKTTASRKAALAFVTVGAALLLPATGQAAQDEWTFGVGSGIRSLSLDGDIGFPTQAGGRVADIDLGNSDTADMFESAFGLLTFANKGAWTIRASYATLSLEDRSSGLTAKWDKAEGELSAEYAFTKTGNHTWGVIGGVRYIDHDWTLKNRATGEKSEPDDDWTDALVGFTHRVPIATNWAWKSRADYSFGDSEGSFNATTGVDWTPFENWVFSGSLRYQDIEFGDKGDIGKSDFYYYNTEETTIGVGVAYTW